MLDIKNKLSISFRTKLLLLCMTPLVFVSIMALTVVQKSNSLVSDLRYVVINTISAVTVSKDMVNDVNMLSKSFYLMSSEQISDNQFDDSFIAVEDAIQRLNMSARMYKDVKMPEQASGLREKMLEQWGITSAEFPKIIELLDSGDLDAAKSIFNSSLKEGLGKIKASLSNIELNNVDVIEQRRDQIKAIGQIDDKTSTVFALVLNGSVLIFLLFFVKKLINSLTSTAKVLDGTVDSSIVSSDEVNNIATTVMEIFREISNSLEDTTSSSLEIRKMSESNSNSITKSQEISKKNIDGINESVKVSLEMEQMFKKIQSSSNELEAVMGENKERMQEIFKLLDLVSEKTSMINGIVFQTKLLSFNASVEAARAGESGKGFSVVAEEVGSLAKMSGDSATEIFEILEDSRSKIDEILKESDQKNNQAIQRTNKLVDSSIQLVKGINTEFNKLKDSIKESNEIGESISKASDEQLSGLKMLDDSFNKINQLSSKSTSQVEELSKSSSKIQDEASKSSDAIEHLIKLVS